MILDVDHFHENKSKRRFIELDLTKEQNECVESIISWYRSYSINEDYLLCGYAGTGKTSIISELRKVLNISSIAFVAVAAKAADVLRKKLQENNVIKTADFCGTLHSLLYFPETDERGHVKRWVLKNPESITNQLIIIDEASMVSEELYLHLKSLGKRCLFVGDDCQLPPVQSKFNILNSEPNYKLTQIHRQAENDPIIYVSKRIRNEGNIDYGQYGKSVAKVKPKHSLATKFIDNTKDFRTTYILCATNKTRVNINKKIRKKFYEVENDIPEKGERVICLLNDYNSENVPVYNGTIGTINGISDNESFYNVEVSIDGEQDSYFGPISKKTFNQAKPDMVSSKVSVVDVVDDDIQLVEKELDFWDFGYCLTVHKAQGTQAYRTMVFNEYTPFWDDDFNMRWLYTAVTRSIKQLLIVE